MIRNVKVAGRIHDHRERIGQPGLRRRPAVTGKARHASARSRGDRTGKAEPSDAVVPVVRDQE
jgi:hypothetical protein